MERADLLVVGAGAAGLATAIFAAETARASASPDRQSPRIVLLDGAKRIGAKILVSGGGRCNVTHRVVRPEDFHGNRNFVRRVLRGFDAAAAVKWFATLGVELKEEPTGKLFPVSDSARTVLDALLQRAASLGVEVLPGRRVASITCGPRGFEAESSQERWHSPRLVLATGGRSLPKSGSDGHGWSMARELGHRVTRTWPALVPLLLRDDFPHADLSGISHSARLSVRVGGPVVESCEGELLWTHFGISGPVAMDISRTWVGAAEESEEGEGLAPRLEANLIPATDRETLESSWIEEGRRTPTRPLLGWLGERLPRRVARTIVALAGIDGAAALSQIPRPQRRALLARLFELELPVTGPRSWVTAEVTAGGIPLDEVDPRSLESRIVPGLTLVGEILDVDGRIGGFNFQWAWAGGHMAGSAIGRKW